MGDQPLQGTTPWKIMGVKVELLAFLTRVLDEGTETKHLKNISSGIW
jgi:hypothetical protein